MKIILITSEKLSKPLPARQIGDLEAVTLLEGAQQGVRVVQIEHTAHLKGCKFAVGHQNATMLITFQLGQYLTQWLAIEDEFAPLPGGQRARVGGNGQYLVAESCLALRQDDLAITANTERRIGALNGIARGLDHEGAWVGDGVEQRLTSAQRDPSFRSAESHAHCAGAVQQYL